MNRRQVLAAILAVPAFAALAGPAWSGSRLPFDAAAFAEAQAIGAPILIDIAADWCPTCRAQKPIIDSLLAAPGNETLLVFEVDFDRQADVVRAFDARSQSTLIAYRGKVETGRSIGDTRPNSIAALIQSAVAP
ncbi:MAG: thioredoxin family protein [Zavarzinia sp.]|nr:thioredoxin family protein [Zavarzinia sp.]